ncbi:methyltransferase domain-containing protein [Legionella adelaidensis]|uniref:methyltransferase domain-containing protein n=1 Tax=Legionella adelaidensis TaxID=45056 RepID=UPI00138F8F39|nr:class I SAM-dependent methyltransferase [Legionella adelaidensis]
MLNKVSFMPKSRVLDVGCGDGLITNEISTIVEDGCVFGTDISQEMIGYAVDHYSRQNLRFICMDASKNIFREQFDVVVSLNCLHWVSKQQDALDGIGIALVPGGQVAILLSHKKSEYHIVLDNLCTSDKWKAYFANFESPRYFFDPDNYKEMLLRAGLHIVEFIEEEMVYTFQTTRQLREFFSASGAQIKQIPEEKKEEFLNDFVAEYLKQIKCTETIPVSFWCLQIICNKPKPVLVKEPPPYHPQLFARL